VPQPPEPVPCCQTPPLPDPSDEEDDSSCNFLEELISWIRNFFETIVAVIQDSTKHLKA